MVIKVLLRVSDIGFTPNNTTLLSIQLLGLSIAAAPVLSPMAIPAVLGAVGFSTTGPVAGSLAAGWQSSIGLVQAGSIFAWCQSVAMGGTSIVGFTTGLLQLVAL
jgi:hypothetical protein